MTGAAPHATPPPGGFRRDLGEQGLRRLLEDVREGRVSLDEALGALRRLPFDDLGYAKLDSHRALRMGFAEVVLCEGKRPEQVAAIMRRCAEGPGPALATRASAEVAKAVHAVIPEVRYEALARVLVYEPEPLPKRPGVILVVSAGTSDIPVAEEAAVAAEVMGNRVERLFDVGVAGLHRLLAHLETLTAASVLVVVAGMEAALASVVGGLVRKPVIAVPTSVGYGASFDGLAALLGALNACAPGVTVVNIDNGFGAGYSASLINAGASAGTG
ncbi:MAG: nickel pincer cofactor biosynthesis protein LarB [Nitriliruptorales bacterium]|nr:nickel pincer cofactor biosynthesis protein LarB [Nitriliruptorales bacterium]